MGNMIIKMPVKNFVKYCKILQVIVTGVKIGRKQPEQSFFSLDPVQYCARSDEQHNQEFCPFQQSKSLAVTLKTLIEDSTQLEISPQSISTTTSKGYYHKNVF